MSSWIYIAFAVVAAFAVVRLFRRGADVTSWADHAVASGDLRMLVEHIEKNDADPGTSWDQAIGQLWQAYNRETAARLVVEGARRTEAPVLQYWIKRFQEVEPELADEHFSEEFLERYYRPEVASKCGRSCGCG